MRTFSCLWILFLTGCASAGPVGKAPEDTGGLDTGTSSPMLPTDVHCFGDVPTPTMDMNGEPLLQGHVDAPSLPMEINARLRHNNEEGDSIISTVETLPVGPDGSFSQVLPETHRELTTVTWELTPSHWTTGSLDCPFVGVDAQGPEVSVTRPVDDGVTWGTFYVEGTASDTFSESEELNIEVDWETRESSAEVITATVSHGAFSFQMPDIAEGTQQIFVRITDAFDNTTTTTITLEQVPGIEVISPSFYSILNADEMIALEAAALQDPANVVDLQWSATIDGVTSPIAPNTDGSFTAQFTEGEYVLTASMWWSDGVEDSSSVIVFVASP